LIWKEFREPHGRDEVGHGHMNWFLISHLVFKVPSFICLKSCMCLDFGQFLQDSFLDIVHEFIFRLPRFPNLPRFNLRFGLVAESKDFASFLSNALIIIVREEISRMIVTYENFTTGRKQCEQKQFRNPDSVK